MNEIEQMEDSGDDLSKSHYMTCIGEVPLELQRKYFDLKPHLGLGLPIRPSSTHQFLIVVFDEKIV